MHPLWRLVTPVTPSCFFGSETYFEGHLLEATGYSSEKALVIKHELAVSRQESKCEPGPLICARVRVTICHNGLRDDKVLYHYTDEASFFLTILEGAKILALLRKRLTNGDQKMKSVSNISTQDDPGKTDCVPIVYQMVSKKIAGSDRWPFAKPFLWFAT